MPKDEIVVEIDTDGTTTVKVKGVAGPGCHALTKELEDALGDRTITQNTPEFAQRTKATSRTGARAQQR